MKTAIPRLLPRHLTRRRLLSVLDNTAADQVTVLSAPAGYGKTVLLAEWAALSPERTAWLAVDEDDNDDRRLWSALLTALASCVVVPELSDLRRLRVPPRPSHDHEFVALVLDAIEKVPSELRLVLDDVHELTAADPLHGIGVLVRDRPPGLRLVLSSRTDPPLPLGRMRLLGQLCEIRGEELRFSPAEAEKVLTAAEVVLEPDQVGLLVAQTEGWAAGLRLAALSLRGSPDPELLLSDLVGNSREMSDYLVSEILARLPTEARQLLGAVSVCEWLSAPLAATLSGRPDAGEVLDALEHETSLVVSSGRGRIWYRVHPLLRSQLRADLQRRRPELLVELHARAAAWFTDHDQPVPGINHARLAGDPVLLIRLLRRHALTLVGSGRLRIVREALGWLAEQGRADDAWLAMLGIVVHLEAGDGPATQALLERLDALWPADPPPELVGLRERVRIRLAVADGSLDARTVAEVVASRAVEPDEPALAIMGQLERATVLAVAGRAEDALQTARPALDRARELGQGLLVAQGYTVLAHIAATVGDYRLMSEMARCADHDLAPSTEWATTRGAALSAMLQAFGALLRAEPGRCLDHVGAVQAFVHSASRPRVPGSMVATSRALRGAALADVGREAEGLAELGAAREVAHTVGAPDVLASVALLEHGAATAAGRHDTARTVLGWAERTLPDSGEVALLRAQRSTAHGRHRAAGAALAPLLDGSAPAVSRWALIEAWVLDCRLALLDQRLPRARSSLGSALELTRVMDARRPLAAAPAEVVDLLVRHLGSYGALEPTAQQVLGARHALGIDRHDVALTDREQTVLHLLPSQRSFEEIAGDLAVSHSTVKTHVRAIYSKLGVSSRRDAVDSARRHGLLRPDTEWAPSSSLWTTHAGGRSRTVPATVEHARCSGEETADRCRT